MGIRMDRDILGVCQRDLAVQDGVSHCVAGFDNRINSRQIRIQFIQIGLDSIHVARSGISFECLDMIAIIMTPAPDLLIHILHFGIVGFDQLSLIGCNSLILFFLKQWHETCPPMSLL